MSETLTSIDLPLERLGSGKVREIYEIDTERLLIVATDRISAFDVVMSQGIPDKARVLTGISRFWFERLAGVCPHHLLSADTTDLPERLASSTEDLKGRFMIVKRLEMLPVEFVIRGYLVGSGWKDYQATGAVCGIRMPAGLEQASKLPEPIFTPATKAQSGHDLNITEDEAAELCGGADLLKTAKDYSLTLYERAREHAASHSIILADTKFEFGTHKGEVVLGDEVLTPDSSRFWPADEYSTGISPPSFDKQFVRDWLETTGWDKSGPPPELPADISQQTRSKYVEAYERLTGESFSVYLERG